MIQLNFLQNALEKLFPTTIFRNNTATQ